MISCADCGMPYCTFPLDVALPDDQWAQISGRTDGGGILCAHCILARAANLGATVARMSLDLPAKKTGYFWKLLRFFGNLTRRRA